MSLMGPCVTAACLGWRRGGRTFQGSLPHWSPSLRGQDLRLAKGKGKSERASLRAVSFLMLSIMKHGGPRGVSLGCSVPEEPF